jgi:uncharacterized OB-fold protein
MQLQNKNPSSAGISCTSISLLRCLICEQLTYPAAAYGCSRCGAARENGEEVLMPARGELLNWVTVFVDLVPGLKAPYVVGEVRIAPGVVEEVVIDVASEADLSVGQQMVAIAHDAATQTAGAVNDQPVKPVLRFIPETVLRGVAK